MKKPADSSDSLTALHAFTESNDEAASRQFCQICRASPALREWLWEEFARKPKTRAKLADALAKESSDEDAAIISTGNRSLRIETAALRGKMSARIYGGLTWSEIEELVRHYQAGELDLGTFLLVNEWKRENHDDGASPRLVQASAEWFGHVVQVGDIRLLRHVGNTLRLLATQEKMAKRRGLFGHSDWWKLNALFYMLRHPREAYRTRELRTHLSDLGIDVSTKDIRRFCTRHGIRRDMRAGRPRST